MNYRHKKVRLNENKLIPHPCLINLIKNDGCELKTERSINDISVDIIQSLLDRHPIPVIKGDSKDSYFTLTPSGFLERFKSYPLSAKLIITLLIYPHEHLETVLYTSLLYNPAFSVSLSEFSRKNIHERHKLCRKKATQPPSKKALANLANRSPSFLR